MKKSFKKKKKGFTATDILGNKKYIKYGKSKNEQLEDEIGVFEYAYLNI